MLPPGTGQPRLYEQLFRPAALDSEQKATELRLLSLARPHMVAFHASWLMFCSAFFVTFSTSALLPVVRDDLDLSRTDISNAGVALICGSLAARVFMGSLCDIYGPRLGTVALLCLSSPAAFCLIIVETPAGFITCRLFVGLSLATFVGAQVWCNNMFSSRVLGTTTAVASGWGNFGGSNHVAHDVALITCLVFLPLYALAAGGGLAALVMPHLFHLCERWLPRYQAWRAAQFIPGVLILCMAVLVAVATEDHPVGSMWDLRRQQLKKSEKYWPAMRHVFEAETQLHKPALQKAQVESPLHPTLASAVRLARIACRNYRTWALAVSYGYCLGLELTTLDIISYYLFDQFDLTLADSGLFASLFGLLNVFTRPLGGILSDKAGAVWGMRGRLWYLWATQSLGAMFCILTGRFSTDFRATMACLVLFSVFTQQACGGTYGVVPYVSFRASGFVCGLVAAGGNAGGALMHGIFFSGSGLQLDSSITWMGVMAVTVTLVLHLVYFPAWGSTLLPPSKSTHGAAELDYYGNEYDMEEVMQGRHLDCEEFGMNTRDMRGTGRRLFARWTGPGELGQIGSSHHLAGSLLQAKPVAYGDVPPSSLYWVPASRMTQQRSVPMSTQPYVPPHISQHVAYQRPPAEGSSSGERSAAGLLSSRQDRSASGHVHPPTSRADGQREAPEPLGIRRVRSDGVLNGSGQASTSTAR